MQATKTLLFSISVLFTGITLFAQVSNEYKTVPLDGAKYGLFGTSVAMDGDYAVIGEYASHDNAGCAYVFKREGISWKQVQKLSPPLSTEFDMFGFSVDISGDYIVVGAFGNTSSTKGYAAIYKLEGGSWKYRSQLQHSSIKGGEKFGYSVAIDGEYAVIGAPWQDAPITQQGAAYVFKREGEYWDSKAKLLAADAKESGHFGQAVSISQRQILVGAPAAIINGERQGAVYLFLPDKEIWKPGVRFTEGAGTDEYGISVKIKGSRFIAGAVSAYADEVGHGAAYIYKYVPKDSTWIMEKKLISSTTKFSNYYGSSVSLDGDYVLVSDNFDEEKGSHAGAVFLYKLINGKWILQKKVIASDAKEEHEFGFVVTIQNHNMLVGSPYDDVQGIKSGSVYFYKY